MLHESRGYSLTIYSTGRPSAAGESRRWESQNMDTSFHASEVSTVPVDGTLTVAFADSSLEHYLLLQLDEESNDHYLEFGDQSKSCYGAVDLVLVRSSGVKFLLSLEASGVLGAKVIEVKCNLSESELQSMSDTLSLILGGFRVQVQ